MSTAKLVFDAGLLPLFLRAVLFISVAQYGTGFARLADLRTKNASLA